MFPLYAGTVSHGQIFHRCGYTYPGKINRGKMGGKKTKYSGKKDPKKTPLKKKKLRWNNWQAQSSLIVRSDTLARVQHHPTSTSFTVKTTTTADTAYIPPPPTGVRTKLCVPSSSHLAHPLPPPSVNHRDGIFFLRPIQSPEERRKIGIIFGMRVRRLNALALI